MVPAVTEGGRSFKGAFAYYAHDKRREGEAERLTSDRVAWTHTVNLADRRPGTGMADHGRTPPCGRTK